MQDLCCLHCGTPIAKAEMIEGTLVLIKGTSSELMYDDRSQEYFVKCSSCNRKNGFKEFACQGTAIRFVLDRLL